MYLLKWKNTNEHKCTPWCFATVPKSGLLYWSPDTYNSIMVHLKMEVLYILSITIAVSKTCTAVVMAGRDTSTFIHK